MFLCFFGGPVKKRPLTTSSERGRRGIGCRGGCHGLHHLCGGGRRLFETSSAAFLICRIGTGIPYLAEVLRRLISICRTLRKTKHKAKQSCSLAGRLLQGAQPGQRRGGGCRQLSPSVHGVEICKSPWRLPRPNQKTEGGATSLVDRQTDTHTIRRAKSYGEQKLCMSGTLQGTPA